MARLQINLEIDDVLYTPNSGYVNSDIFIQVDRNYGGDQQPTAGLYNPPCVIDDDQNFQYTVKANFHVGYVDYTNYGNGDKLYFSGETGTSMCERVVTFVFKTEHTITYDANGGTNAPPSISAAYKTPIEIYTHPDIQPVRTGYYMKSWNTSPDGSGVSYLPGDLYVGDTDITLYAQWVPLDYIYTSPDGFVGVVPYIYTGNKWKIAVKYIYANTGW